MVQAIRGHTIRPWWRSGRAMVPVQRSGTQPLTGLLENQSP